MTLSRSFYSHQSRNRGLRPHPHPPNPWLGIYNIRPAFINDAGWKLKEGSKPFSYALADKMAPVLRLVWPSAMNPTAKLAEVPLRCIE